MNKKVSLILFLFTFGISIIAFWLIKDQPFVIDEPHHYKEITKLAEGQITMETIRITAEFPGYHLAMAFLRRLLDINSLSMTRFLSTIFSLFSVFIFYLISKNISPAETPLKTLQFFLFPLLFVFFFIIYTDCFSLFLLLLAFFFLVKNRYLTSGFFGFLSVMVRQNNIVWLGSFSLYIYLKKYGFRFSPGTIFNFFKDTLINTLVFVGMVLFIRWNGAPILGGGIHPLSIHFDNIFFILFSFFILFLPLNIANFTLVIRLLKNPLSILILGAIFIFYLLTFRVNHPYNQFLTNYFLRNFIASLALSSLENKILFFLPIGYSILSLWVSKLHQKLFYLLYPFTILFLSLLWLVEPRYYIIPFTFFLLFKKQKSLFIEYLTIIIYIVLTGFLFWGTLGRKFFL
jgi:alpha-1,2-glucosyltransferase